MVMAEEETRHRHEMEKRMLASDIKEASRGQFFGFLIGIFTICAGVLCVYLNHPVTGGLIGGGGVIGLVSVFIMGRSKSTSPPNTQGNTKR